MRYAAFPCNVKTLSKDLAQDYRQVIFYEIPYECGDTHSYHLDGIAGGRRQFDTRVAALAYAMQSAKAMVGPSGAHACIAIQGADGNWRTFDPDMLPIR